MQQWYREEAVDAEGGRLRSPRCHSAVVSLMGRGSEGRILQQAGKDGIITKQRGARGGGGLRLRGDGVWGRRSSGRRGRCCDERLSE